MEPVLGDKENGRQYDEDRKYAANP